MGKKIASFFIGVNVWQLNKYMINAAKCSLYAAALLLAQKLCAKKVQLAYKSLAQA